MYFNHHQDKNTVAEIDKEIKNRSFKKLEKKNLVQ